MEINRDLILTVNIWLIGEIKLMLTLNMWWTGEKKLTTICLCSDLPRLTSTMRISWTINKAIPDSIITNMICRSLVLPLLVFDESEVRSSELALRPKNTFRILNTIKPVTRVFTAMDAARLVWITGGAQAAFFNLPWLSNVVAASDPNQVAWGNKLKSAYQMKIDWLTQEYDCQEWRNDHDIDILTPHDPTTIYLWRFKWIRQMIDTIVMRTKMHWARKSQQPLAVDWIIARRNNMNCESIWSWSGCVLIRVCITDKKWYSHRENCCLLQLSELLNHWQG